MPLGEVGQRELEVMSWPKGKGWMGGRVLGHLGQRRRRNLKAAGCPLCPKLRPLQGARLARLSSQPLASALGQGPLEKMSQQ